MIGLAAAISTGAMAEGYSETHVSTTAEGLRTMTVSYADLDMSDPQGKEILELRISRAARNVCGSPSIREVGSLRRATENKECYDSAVANAETQASAAQMVVVSR